MNNINHCNLTFFCQSASGQHFWLPVSLTGNLDRTVTGHLHSGKSVEVAFPEGYAFWVNLKDLFITSYSSQLKTFTFNSQQISSGPYRQLTDEKEIFEMLKDNLKKI